jgi:hypothetical protein
MSGSPRHVCLFAQYHPQRRLRPPLLSYLRELRACGYTVFVASSGEGAPPASDRALLAETGAALLCRPNGGLDFGAWQHLIEAGCADGADRILLANDSVFGPFRPLAPIIERMDGHDVWGMIESRQRGWHLQSWFLQFTGEAFWHEAVQRVFALPFADMDKEDVIASGELGLGAAFQQAGMRCGAVVRHEDANWFARRHRINMMHLDWRHNLVALGLPFIKSELLRDNPMRLPWTPAWEAELRAMGADPAPITDYLFDYTGLPSAPRYPVPVKPISIRLFVGYTLATHDRTLALRYLRLHKLRLTMGPQKLRGP